MIVGNDGIVKIGGVAVGKVISFEFTNTATDVSAVTMDSDNAHHDAGSKDGSGSATALFDPTDSGQGAISDGAKIDLDLFADSDQTGGTKHAGNVMVTDVGASQEVDSYVQKTFSWVGRLTEATV